MSLEKLEESLLYVQHMQLKIQDRLMQPDKNLVTSTILFPVFVPAVIIAVLLVAGTVSNPDLAAEVFTATLAYIIRTFGWFYMLAVAIFLIFIVSVAASKWRQIKLGPDHAEPVIHYATPSVGDPQTVNAARQAMRVAYFHWRFHIWTIYGLVGVVDSF